MNLNGAMILVKKVFDDNFPDENEPITDLARLMVEVYNQGVEDGKGYVRKH